MNGVTNPTFRCEKCLYFSNEHSECNRYPVPLNKQATELCGEWIHYTNGSNLLSSLSLLKADELAIVSEKAHSRGVTSSLMNSIGGL